MKHIPPSSELHKWYHETVNPKAKEAYRELLKKRADNGSSQAKHYLDKIEASIK